MITEQQVKLINKDFPSEALSSDTSRGFALTSIKAMYVIERLNEVFGICGIGWRYAHTPVVSIDGEYVTELAIQFHLGENGTSGAVNWIEGLWVESEPKVWSQPVFAFGGKKPSQKGGSPATDAYKSCITDALTKGASLIGIGHTVFKGQGSGKAAKPENSVPAATATDFFKKVKEKYGSDVPANVKALQDQVANKTLTWAEAVSRL